MQIALHAGAHATDEDRLITCLRNNHAHLSQSGVGVPSPSSYRKLLRDILNRAQDTGLGPDARDLVLDAIGDTGGVDRLVLSNAGFFGTQRMAVAETDLYPAAEARLGLFRQIFAGDEVALFLGLRNPAMFLPALLDSTPFASVADLMRDGNPDHVRWSHLIARIRAAFPEMPITVWCNEDTPVIWARLVRAIAGVDASVRIDGEFSLLSEIMTQPGFQRFQDYLAAHPGMTEAQKQRVITAFLERFADTNAIEEEVDVAGWDAQVIDRLTEIYDADLEAIDAIEDVQVITP